jgi:hypothetical protein
VRTETVLTMMRLACFIGVRQPSGYAIDTAGPALMD